MTHNRRKRSAAILAAAIACGAIMLSGCAGVARATPSLTAQPSADVERGVEYREVDGTPLALDACLPSEATGPVPATVLVHGGAFEKGDRSTMLDLCKQMAKSGFAAFAVDYRLVPDVYPAQVEDVAAAVDWLRQADQIETYGLSGDVSVIGSSAGGIIALSTAEALADAGAPLTSVVALSAAGDLRAQAESLGTPAPDLERVVLGYLGCATAEDCAVAEAASPVTQAAKLPPTLLVHGSAEIIPLQQAEALAAALQEAGVPHQLVVNEGSRHGLQLLDAQTRATLLEFLVANASS